MQNKCGVLVCLSEKAPRIVVILLQTILVHSTWDAGLIQSLDRSYDVSIAFVARGKSLQGIFGMVNSITLLPLNSAALSTVVEAILRARGCIVCQWLSYNIQMRKTYLHASQERP